MVAAYCCLSFHLDAVLLLASPSDWVLHVENFINVDIVCSRLDVCICFGVPDDSHFYHRVVKTGSVSLNGCYLCASCIIIKILGGMYVELCAVQQCHSHINYTSISSSHVM